MGRPITTEIRRHQTAIRKPDDRPPLPEAPDATAHVEHVLRSEADALRLTKREAASRRPLTDDAALPAETVAAPLRQPIKVGDRLRRENAVAVKGEIPDSPPVIGPRRPLFSLESAIFGVVRHVVTQTATLRLRLQPANTTNVYGPPAAPPVANHRAVPRCANVSPSTIPDPRIRQAEEIVTLMA